MLEYEHLILATGARDLVLSFAGWELSGVLGAQGAIALQVRAGEEHLVAAADHEQTRMRVEAERTVVAAVGGGCLAPVAAHHDGETLVGLVAAEDGSWAERIVGDDPETLGRALADANRRHA